MRLPVIYYCRVDNSHNEKKWQESMAFRLPSHPKDDSLVSSDHRTQRHIAVPIQFEHQPQLPDHGLSGVVESSRIRSTILVIDAQAWARNRLSEALGCGGEVVGCGR